MEKLDSRRYTGPNLVWDRPGAVMEIECDDTLRDTVIESWSRHARALLGLKGALQSEAAAKVAAKALSVRDPRCMSPVVLRGGHRS